MSITRKFMPGAIAPEGSGLGDRQIRVIASDATIDRAGDVLLPRGCLVGNYLKNPIVLADHNTSLPIGTARIMITDEAVIALIEFAPAGLSAKADEYCALAKAGVLGAVSVGFASDDFEPRGGGGVLFKTWELMELSLVAVPCNPSALVVQRSLNDEPVITEIKMPESTDKPVTTRRKRKAAAVPVVVKSLYDIGNLAWMLSCLGGLQERARVEASIEGDASTMPATLLTIMHDMGAALIAMTQEEVSELLAAAAGEPDDDDGDDLPDEDAEILTAAATPGIRKFLRGYLTAKNAGAFLKSGKKISAQTADVLKSAMDQHADGLALCRKAMTEHTKAMKKIEGLIDKSADEEDEDTTETQSTGEDKPDEGSKDAVVTITKEQRQRQAEILRLAL